MERKLIRKCSTIAVAGLFVAFGAVAQETAQSDKMFARDAAMGGMEEVELGKLAVKNGQNDKVKQFGQRMIDDHSKANEQLKSIAAKNNIDLPTSLDASKRAMVDKFSRMSGAAFDKAYMQDMVKDHETDVAAFRKEADSGSNTDLKNFAGSTMPTLQDHLRMAKEYNSALMSSK